ncbi:1-acyl-sn-glycerol-3-phosphate acyltransferase [Seramator thermalis]|uniref:1-acyl-sn-glycerol-3-phosphate acyltransferase n=1 Tax=Seramator thermalis TaxID=2496270 RepID=UPI00101BF370|nr:1-acyl-sn-glycerol-3-phosphate acyltransferase [Seramator thermalis]
MWQKISKIILKTLGWKITNIIPDIPKCVLAIAPHTSNWDFLIAKLAYTSLGRNAHFLIKKEWFFFPFNLFFKSIGGIPVDRSKKQSMTDIMAEEFGKRDRFQIAITPEGTRKRVTEWKRGFYYIADKAQVPIVLIGLDYKNKIISFLDVFTPTSHVEEDMLTIQSRYKGLSGKNPDNFSS